METLKIKGKEYPATFGLYALRLIGKKYKAKKLVEMTQALQSLSVDDMPFVVEAVIKNGLLKTNGKPPSQKDIEDELNDSLALMFKVMNMLQMDEDDVEDLNQDISEAGEDPGN